MWSRHRTPTPAARAVLAACAGALVAVVAIGQPVAQATPPLHRTSAPAGCAWENAPSPSFSGQLFGVTALSSTDAWSVGYETGGPLLNEAIIEHWNGSRWHVVRSPQPGAYRDYLEKVAAVSADDVWAVGGYQNERDGSVRRQRSLVEHWDGARWRVVSSPSVPGADTTLAAIVALAADDIWTVGFATSPDGRSQALAEHWDGSAWAVVPTPDPGSYMNTLGSLSAVSSTDIWAAGAIANGRLGLNRTLTVHWDGTAWHSVRSADTGSLGDGLAGIAAVAANDVWAAGYYGYPASDGSLETATMAEHWNGTRWRVVLTPDPPGGDNGLHGITALASNQVWAVGFSVEGPVIIRWNGLTWVTMNAPGNPNRTLWSITALSPHRLWSVGSFAFDSLIMRAC